MNKVYQHGDELFVTLDATPRMRNLRTGLTITPRVPFKYLGEMPQVGQVWVGNLTGLPKTIKSIEGDTVCVELGNGTENEIRLRALFSNHTLQPTEDLDFSWIGEACTETFEQLGKSFKQLVEDGRVYYTDGSSGLRRFLNEYCRVAFKPDILVLDFANLRKITNDPPTNRP